MKFRSISNYQQPEATSSGNGLFYPVLFFMGTESPAIKDQQR